MSQPIQEPGVGAALQRLFRLQGRVRPALEEFVIPVVNVGALELGSPPPLTFLSTVQFGQGAVAGELFTARFETPGSVLAEILEIRYEAAAAAGLRIGFPGNAATIVALANNAGQKRWVDGRIPAQTVGVNRPASVITFGTQVAALATFEFVDRCQAAVPRIITFPRGVVIGTSLPSLFGFMELQLSVANTAMNSMTILWREYAAA